MTTRLRHRCCFGVQISSCKHRSYGLTMKGLLSHRVLDEEWAVLCGFEVRWTLSAYQIDCQSINSVVNECYFCHVKIDIQKVRCPWNIIITAVQSQTSDRMRIENIPRFDELNNQPEVIAQFVINTWLAEKVNTNEFTNEKKMINIYLLVY